MHAFFFYMYVYVCIYYVVFLVPQAPSLKELSRRPSQVDLQNSTNGSTNSTANGSSNSTAKDAAGECECEHNNHDPLDAQLGLKVPCAPT